CWFLYVVQRAGHTRPAPAGWQWAYPVLQKRPWRYYPIARPLRHFRLPLLPPGAISVAKAKDRQSQAPQRRKIAPQAWWLARHSRTNAIKAQMDTPQNLSTHS